MFSMRNKRVRYESGSTPESTTDVPVSDDAFMAMLGDSFSVQ